MIRKLFCITILFSVARATNPPSEDLAFSESFSIAWSIFDSACKNGDAPTLLKCSDERINKWLDGEPLAKFLGDGWKADSVTIKRKTLIVPHGRYSAGAFLIVEVSEFGKPTLHAMWWVYDDSRWSCLNLPFESTLLPPKITYPPFPESESNKSVQRMQLRRIAD